MLTSRYGAVIGRTRELAIVSEAVADVVAGRGRSLLIVGEPGIGKSTLLSAGLTGASASGCEVLRGGCDELGQRFPLSAMMRALDVDIASPDPRRAHTAAILGQPAHADGWSVNHISGDPVTAAIEQLLELVDRLCATAAVVLVLEDLHWADEASLLSWRRLCRATRQLPLLLVGTCRPVPHHEELERVRREVESGNGTVISLGPLDEEGVAQLAGRLAGGVPGPRLRERLESAAGNPLYIDELIIGLSRAGAVRIEGGAAEILNEDRADGPAVSLTGVIAEHLNSLSADTREVLRTAALLGVQFSVTDLALVLGRTPGELVGLVEAALKAGVLEPAGARLRFRHGLLRQVLYEAMPQAVRAALYRHIAEALIGARAPVDRIAEVLLSAPEAADGWEVEWLLRNVGELAGRAPAVAAQVLEHSLGCSNPADPSHAAMEDQLAEVCFLLLRHPRTVSITRAILAATTDPKRIGRAVWLLGYTLSMELRMEESAKLVGGYLADERADPVWRARIRALQSLILLEQNCHAEALEAAEWALAEGRGLDDATAMAYALHSGSIVRYRGGDTGGALEQVDQALPLSSAKPYLTDLRLQLLSNRATATSDLDREEEARESLRQARMLGERIGTPRLASIQLASAKLAYRSGSWDDAMAELGAITELEGQGDQSVMRDGLTALITLRRNDRRQATPAFDTPEDHLLTVCASYRCAARALDHEQAGRTLEASVALRVLLAPENAALTAANSNWMPLLVRLALAAGDDVTAAAAAEACRLQAETTPRPDTQASVDWCHGLVHADPASILKAAAFHRGAGRRPDLANALEDAAVLLAGAGELDGARTALTEAMSLYDDLGAAWDARRAAARARPYGLRLGARGLRQRPKVGWRALTPTELLIADLVSQGRSNPEIAGDLMLSRRTVESHVSHILGKLQVRSRREIAELHAKEHSNR